MASRDPKDEMIAALKKQVEELQAQLKAKEDLTAPPPDAPPMEEGFGAPPPPPPGGPGDYGTPGVKMGAGAGEPRVPRSGAGSFGGGTKPGMGAGMLDQIKKGIILKKASPAPTSPKASAESGGVAPKGAGAGIPGAEQAAAAARARAERGMGKSIDEQQAERRREEEAKRKQAVTFQLKKSTPTSSKLGGAGEAGKGRPEKTGGGFGDLKSRFEEKPGKGPGPKGRR